MATCGRAAVRARRIVMALPHRERAMAGALNSLRYAVLAEIGGRFPVFLAPSPDVTVGELAGRIEVRIYWDQI